MNTALLDLFKEYREAVSSDEAAASLALADVLLGKTPNQRMILNPGDVAKQLSVSPATVTNWIRTGQLKAANIAHGHRPRFIIQQADVDAFLRFRQVIPPPPRQRRRRRLPTDRY